MLKFLLGRMFKLAEKKIFSARLITMLIGVSLAAILTACIATSQTISIQMDAEISQIYAEKDREMDAEPVVVELRKKLLGNDRNGTLEKLTNPEFPTESDKFAIAIYYSLMSSFQQKYIDIVRRYDPAYVNIFELHRAAFTTLSIELYTQKITFGEYNRRVDEGNQKINEAIRQRDVESAADRSRQASVARAAILSYSQYLQSQRLINSMNRPMQLVPFTCQRIGSRTTCS